MDLRSVAVLTAAVAFAPSCGGDPTGPRGSLCDTRHDIEVCVDRAEYQSGDVILISSRNMSGRPVLRDGCASGVARVPDSEDDYRPVYSPRRNCGVAATRADVLGHMAWIEPGALDEQTLRLGYSPQDFFRAQVWLMTPEGDPAFDTPATSGVFVIFPGANN